MAIQSNLVKKILIIGGVLAVVQIGAIFFMSKGEAPAATPKESIDLAVSKLKNLSPDRREMMKVQIAIADFMAKHQGVPPKTLNELVGPYFQSIPLDPATNKPFKYTVDGKRYLLGDKPAAASSQQQPSKAGIPGTTSANPGQQKTLSPQELDAARDELLSVLTQDDSQKNPPYDPVGKKDPFKPFEIAPKDTNLNPHTALETIPLEKLSYSAYVESDSEPKAIIETSEGRGYTATKGMKIGTNQGEITDILPNKVVVVETQTDFTGQKQSRTFEIPIGVKRYAEPNTK